jgi:hypothetical protein
VALGASALGAFPWSHIWIYLLAELVAGGLAAAAFLLIHPAEQAAPPSEVSRPDGSGAPHRISPARPGTAPRSA